jgi:CheY-like chemotaxis protein
MYFPAFAALLDERSYRDPISEFLDYVFVRTMQRRGTSTIDDQREIERILKEHGISWTFDGGTGAAGDDETPLAQLERELPEMFPDLASDEDFVSLLEGFGEPTKRERLRAKLGRRSDAPRPLPFEGVDVIEGSASAGAVAAGGSVAGVNIENVVQGELPLTGVQILWIDDRPEGNQRAIQTIERRGGKVALAKNGAEAIRHIRTRPRVDMIISDITRGDNHNAGFEDLERIRAETGYEGRVIFNTSRVTPARRDQAASLNAAITSNPWELFEWIDELPLRPPDYGATEKTAQKVAPA